MIDGGGLYYRGRDVLDLAEESTIEEVAALIWTGDEAMAPALFPPEMSEPSRRIRTVVGSVAGLPPVEVFQVLLPLAAAEDPAAYDLRPGAVARTGARILRLMTDVAAGESAPGLAGTLRRGWGPEDPGAESLLGCRARVLRGSRVTRLDLRRQVRRLVRGHALCRRSGRACGARGRQARGGDRARRGLFAGGGGCGGCAGGYLRPSQAGGAHPWVRALALS